MLQILKQIHRIGELDLEMGKPFEIVISSQSKPTPRVESKQPIYDSDNSVMKKDGFYTIQVKKYMTEPSTPTFDFQDKWNNGVPMPLCIMRGQVVKETRGMYYMKLQADIVANKMCSCMKCGRTITNPVSQYFGIGPECGNHHYVNPFESDEELKQAVDAYKQELRKTKWEGWVIKTAIKSWESYKPEE